MDFPTVFIGATREWGGFDNHIPAPCIRKAFTLEKMPEKPELLICGLGYYRVFVNGREITKGPLAPYTSNPDSYTYFDKYDLTDLLQVGENVIGVILGNGMTNGFDGYVWDFDTAKHRGAPRVALSITDTAKEEDNVLLTSDTSFKTHPSPILFDSLRCGEIYDARLEIDSWCDVGFDDTSWDNCIISEVPRGKAKVCECEPIVVSRELKPVSVVKHKDGWLYDFGVNYAGVTRIKIRGESGQTITVDHGDWIHRGEFDTSNYHKFYPEGYSQKTVYTLKGGETEVHVPSFTYYGFRYAYVTGITEEQATEELLTYLVMHTDLKENGDFECSDEIINALQKMVRVSDLANFYYFPTDCPHREKNGWTGDAAVSAEHMLLNLTPENAYREWLFNIRDTQTETGKLPGIIPTGGWGYKWGNGPCWDQVMTMLPYMVYKYRGTTKILKENATSIMRYINYLDEHLNERGLIDFGLGDWVHANRHADKPIAPVEVTNSIVSMNIAAMAEHIFKVLGKELQMQFARAFKDKIRRNIRKHLINFATMTVAGRCQTSQALAIYYGVFEEGERAKALEVLLKLIEEKDYHIDAGMLGLRVIFHVLSDAGYADIAFKMIVRKDPPSYGHWVAQGFTSLPEEFRMDYTDFATSYNHHFLGDISNWFIQAIGGIKLNPNADDVNCVRISPEFITDLRWAKAWHNAPLGKIEVSWRRDGEKVLLSVNVPEGMKGEIVLPAGYTDEDGYSLLPLVSVTDLVCIKA